MSNIVEVDALANVHWHGREGQIVGSLIERAIEGGADVLGLMPNTDLGLTTADRVFGNLFQTNLWGAAKNVRLLPFLMITETTSQKEIEKCLSKGYCDGKVYPRDRTTKSENGVRNYGRLLPIIKVCGELGMKVHLHPEHPSKTYDNREAENAFLAIVDIFLNETDAVIIWEHGTDARCIPHWENFAKGSRFYVTLTAHHLATNEDRVFGDVRAVCKPPIKTEADRKALVELVAKNYSWVMAGGDDAFHDQTRKHVDQGGCACGAYTSPFLLPLYAHALGNLLQEEKGIGVFVNFTSRNARKLHHLPDSSRTIKLLNECQQIPLHYQIEKQVAVPFWAGQFIDWKIIS